MAMERSEHVNASQVKQGFIFTPIIFMELHPNVSQKNDFALQAFDHSLVSSDRAQIVIHLKLFKHLSKYVLLLYSTSYLIPIGLRQIGIE